MNRERLFGVAACAAVILGVGLAFFVIGTPGHARLIALDQKRLDDLRTISLGLQARYRNGSEPLPSRQPSDLSALGSPVSALRDPATGRTYEYRKLDRSHFALCATFTLRSEAGENEPAYDATGWYHGAGHTCYQFDTSTYGSQPQLLGSGLPKAGSR